MILILLSKSCLVNPVVLSFLRQQIKVRSDRLIDKGLQARRLRSSATRPACSTETSGVLRSHRDVD
jgi:hypothetical protein